MTKRLLAAVVGAMLGGVVSGAWVFLSGGEGRVLWVPVVVGAGVGLVAGDRGLIALARALDWLA